VKYVTSQDETLLWGTVRNGGIHCDCCRSQVSCSQFEVHAGRGSRRAPYDNIFTHPQVGCQSERYRYVTSPGLLSSLALCLCHGSGWAIGPTVTSMSRLTPPGAASRQVIPLRHTSGCGASPSIKFMSRLRVRPLTLCYVYVTPAG
jgi:hypothetical protein